MTDHDELCAHLRRAGFGEHAEALSYHPLVRHAYDEGGADGLRSYFDSILADEQAKALNAMALQEAARFQEVLRELHNNGDPNAVLNAARIMLAKAELADVHTAEDVWNATRHDRTSDARPDAHPPTTPPC